MIGEHLNNREKQSQAALVSFVDLLFLMVAFMVLMLVLIGKRSRTNAEFEAMQQTLSTLAGRPLSAAETLQTLRPVLKKLQQHKRHQTNRAKQRASRSSVVLNYALKSNGSIVHKGVVYPNTQTFLQKVVIPLRAKYWVGLRAAVDANTSFRQVIASRRLVLQKRTPFDTYWDNLGRQKP